MDAWFVIHYLVRVNRTHCISQSSKATESVNIEAPVFWTIPFYPFCRSNSDGCRNNSCILSILITLALFEWELKPISHWFKEVKPSTLWLCRTLSEELFKFPFSEELSEPVLEVSRALVQRFVKVPVSQVSWVLICCLWNPLHFPGGHHRFTLYCLILMWKASLHMGRHCITVSEGYVSV